MPRKTFLTALFLMLGFLASGSFARAQSATPPAPPPLPSPTPTATTPPAILIIQPTPAPTPAPQGNLLEQFWQTYRTAIITALISALIGGILVGVWLKQMAEQLAKWTSQLFHFLFDRFASAPLLRWRFEKQYRETLAAAVQKLASSPLVDREVQLDKVYVPVQLTEETHALGETRLEDYYQWKEDRRRQQRQRALSPWEAVQRFDRLVVLGDPGAGKTTYLAHLAFLCARRERLPTYTPLFIRFRDIGDVTRLEEAFPKALAERNFPNAARFIERRLKTGRCLILLDGLDEVPTETRHQQVIELVQNFADRDHRTQGRGNILVISSRTYSYEHGQQLTGFTKTEVMEFDRPDIERFAYNWFGETQTPLAAELIAELQKTPRFLDLARNPLLLLLITFRYERERNLPKLRAELYQHCIYTRIISWNTQRGTHRGRFGETDKWRMLRELALDFYREAWPRLLDKEALLAWLEKFAANLHFPEDTTPATLLDEVTGTSGLLQEWAIGRYGFSHQTLQEYFAAEGVDRLGQKEGAALLESHFEDPAWKEIILLYCGLADKADLLLRRLLVRAKRGGKMLWLLAGRGLTEGARGVDPSVIQQIAERQVALLYQEPTGEEALTPEESDELIAGLKTYAAALLSEQVESLLAGDTASAALLAARLLPDTAPPALKEAVSAGWRPSPAPRTWKNAAPPPPPSAGSGPRPPPRSWPGWRTPTPPPAPRPPAPCAASEAWTT